VQFSHGKLSFFTKALKTASSFHLSCTISLLQKKGIVCPDQALHKNALPLSAFKQQNKANKKTLPFGCFSAFRLSLLCSGLFRKLTKWFLPQLILQNPAS